MLINIVMFYNEWDLKIPHSAHIVSQNMEEINGNLCTEEIPFYTVLNFLNFLSQLQHLLINLCNINRTFL